MAAVDNMHLAEFEGNIIKCSIAKKSKVFFESQSEDVPSKN
jgi:hypothetical protein